MSVRISGHYCCRAVFLTLIGLLFVNNHALAAGEEARKLVALIDYIGGDYRNAVRAGKIVSADEYREMAEFSARCLELFEQLKAKEGADKAGIEKKLRALTSHISQKTGENAVPQLAQQVKERLIATYEIATHPKSLPNFLAGKIVYTQNCAQCHGDTGKGDGPGALTMQPKEPRPANFLDPELMSGLSPFKAFNTTSFGIEGTAMPNFSALTEEQRWQAAFYVFSLRFSQTRSAAGTELFASAKLPLELKRVETLAALTDGELSEKIQSWLLSKSASHRALAYLRRGALEERTDPLLVAGGYLGEALYLYEQGKRQEAYQKSVDAYLDGFELAEPALFAKDLRLGRELEAKFAEFRGAIRAEAEVGRVRRLYTDLESRLAAATALLETSGSAGGGAYTLLNAALIIVREGVEAALIVSAIIAVLKATAVPRVVGYVHLGWVLAVISGVFTWVMAQTVLSLSGAQRELVEGLTALLAAAVLFSVSYWLISKAEAKKWQRYIQHKLQEALTGRRIAVLVGVSFLAVYREAFETVLFYQALWLQSPQTHHFVVSGFVVGVGLLAAIVWSIFKLGMKMPLRAFSASAAPCFTCWPLSLSVTE